MSAAEQFKAAVTSVSDPDPGWRGGLEHRRARGWASEPRSLLNFGTAFFMRVGS
jgi:hypothetical protein